MTPKRLSSLYRDHIATLGRRYDALLPAGGFDAVILHAGLAKKRTDFDDQYWPLRPTPHFQHWIPLGEAGCAVIVTAGKRPRLLRPRVTDFWERPPTTQLDDFLPAFDLEEPPANGKAPAGLPARVAFIGEAREVAAAWGISDANVNPPELLRGADALRVTKSDYEVACLDEANRRAAVGHEAVLARFRAGTASELELHLAFLSATQQDDPETPYKNIVATGENAAILHHISYGRRPTDRTPQSLLLDAGATFQGYCSDITRTWVKGDGASAATFLGIVQGVEAMQQRLVDAAKVGLPYESLHDECHRQTAVILQEAGVVKGSADEAVSSGVTRVFLPHGLGHSLGLQCHDVGCALVKPRAENPFLRNTAPIAEGQCFTIEPGIYFIDSLLGPLRQGPHAGLVDWALVDALAPLGGVRIEDDLVVMGEGKPVRNLTRAYLPRGGGAA